MSDKETVHPHSDRQSELIRSDADLTIAATGTQWGKSMAGALWMKRKIFQYPDKKNNFLLMAPSYKIMQQSMLPYFLHYMEGIGTYHKVDATFELNWGSIVYFRTETDPDSIVGIPRVKAYWMDEAGKVRLYFHENVQARAASIGAKGLYTTSPYSLNWLYTDYIKPKLAGRLPDIKLIQAASWENKYHSLHDEEKRKKMRQTMDERRFNMVFGGQWDKMAGLVFDCFDQDENMVDPFQLPTGTKYYGGIDWGYTDPFVLKIRAVTPDNRHYQVSEFYKVHTTITDQIQAAKQKMGIFLIERFYADPSQPGAIEEFCRNGIPCVAADNDIRRGIDLHYELIKTRRYKLFKGSSPHTIDEYETYHYPEPKDLSPDQSAKEQKPVDQNNHAMDVERYLTLATYRGVNKHKPHTPSEVKKPLTQAQKIEQLKRGRMNTGTESWT